MASMSETRDRPQQKAPRTPRTPRRASFSIPDRFKDGDDADVDITAPKSKRSQYMNQSFLSMIANVGSNATLDPQFSTESSRLPPTSPSSVARPSGVRATLSSHRSEYSLKDVRARRGQKSARPSKSVSERPTEALNAMHSSDSEEMPGPRRLGNLQSHEDDMATSQILTRPTQASDDREGSSQQGATERSSKLNPEHANRSSMASSESQMSISHESKSKHDDFATELAAIYGFDEPERVDADFPCWLLQSPLLQGTMYITSKHVCFHAYLPRKATDVLKSGFIYKRGRKNPKYRRYWFVLRGSVLSYYHSPSDLYFPRGTFDLRAGTTAQLEGEEASQKPLDFTLGAAGQVHRFRSDSNASAAEWVKRLQEAMFHARNNSEIIKISLPIANILDVEENPVVDFADTFKIRIIDNDETFAIDEYFFSFFNDGKEAHQILKAKIANKALHGDTFISAPSQAGASKAGPSLEPVASISAMGSEFTSTTSTTGDDGTSSAPEQRAPFSTKEIVGSRSDGSRSPNNDEAFDVDTESSSASQFMKHSEVIYQPSSRSRSEEDGSRDDKINRVTLIGSKDSPLSSSETRESQKVTETSQPANLLPQSWSTSTIQNIIRAGTGSVRGASGVTELLRSQSKRVSHVIADETKVYYEKVTNMWAGKTTHFDGGDEAAGVERAPNSDDESSDMSPFDRFRSYFSLSASEQLQATYHGYLYRVVPVFGKVYISERKICFRSLLPGTRTKMILPLEDIETVEKEKGFRFGYSGLVIVVRGHEELFLEFSQTETRDDLISTIEHYLPGAKQRDDDHDDAITEDADAKRKYDALQQARRGSPRSQDGVFQTISIEQETESQPVIFDDLSASVVDFKPVKPQRITCLTIGSRGDVQPYIALCKGLLAEGHQPRIVTHVEFKPWIEYHGIEFAPVAGDPAEIMRLCVEHDMFTVSFLREATSKFRGWIDQLLNSSWKSCQGSDIIIESPSAMAGIHIAEALQIPYFRAFTMPWTRTRAYPHAFAVPSQKLGGNYNLLSYVMFDNVFWRAVSGQLNRWRAKTLGLPPTNLDKLQVNNVPFLYNFSPSVVPPPLDFSPWIRVTGYWFLDERETYEPPPGLADFISKAREDDKKIVYVGFGSIVIDDPAALTKTIVESVQKADVRCVLSKGWSDRLETRNKSVPEFPLSEEIYSIKSAPHDWLFRQIDAAAHHGGAGTTGASLRAGIPTIVKPFFGDQFFFGSRVETLGVGRCLKRINTSVLARALFEVTNSERMINKARLLGEQIRAENGVDSAIQSIYRDLEYAKTLIKSHRKTAASEPEETEDWTLVGDGSDSDTGPRTERHDTDET